MKYLEPNLLYYPYAMRVDIMARKLSSRDIEILKTMVPELDVETFRPTFRSIFPPVSKRFCTTALEFRGRLDRLTDADLAYLVDLIFQGDECLTCLTDEYMDILLDKIRSDISPKKADDLVELLGYINEG